MVPTHLKIGPRIRLNLLSNPAKHLARWQFQSSGGYPPLARVLSRLRFA